MWSEDLNSVRTHFQEIGARHRHESQRCWFDRLFPTALWRELGAEGLFAEITEIRGGFESGAPRLAAALEGLTYGTLDGGFVISVLVHSVLGIGVIDQLGSSELKERYLDRLVLGELILAFAVTESHGGTDPFNPETILSRTADGGAVLNGAKWHITNMPFADVALVLCRSEESGDLAQVLVETNWSGVRRSEAFLLAGARTSPVGEISFENVTIPAANVIPLGRRGARLTLRALQGEKILAAFGVIGVLDHVIDIVLAFVRNRTARGVPLSSHQLLQKRLTDMQVVAVTTRALAHATLERYSRGEEVALESAALKLSALDGGIRSIIDGIQSCGAYGLQDQEFLYPILLDALCGSIGGGTEEAQRTAIFNEMVRRHSRANR